MFKRRYGSYKIGFLISLIIVFYLFVNPLMHERDVKERPRPSSQFHQNIITSFVKIKNKIKRNFSKNSIGFTNTRNIIPTTEILVSPKDIENDFVILEEDNKIYKSIDWFQILKNSAVKIYRELLMPDSISEFRKWAIKKQRDFLRRELKDYKVENQREFDDLFMEKHGEPIRSVIFTTWRSGSTFVGEILNSHPGTFYHYEPLLPLEVIQVRSGALAEEAANIIRNVLNCKFTREYIKYGDNHFWFHRHNIRLSQYCESQHEVCFDPNFVSSMCQLFPFQALKTVRLRLHLAKALLDDRKLDIKVLYLIRDPRGTIQSRQHRTWCSGIPDCDSPRILCKDLEDDFYAADSLRRQYPSRIMILRYEDFALNIYTVVKKLFAFFGLQYHPQVDKFLRHHSTYDEGGRDSTRRNSKTIPFHWKRDFENFEKVKEIQFHCAAAMSLWGYKMANNKTHMLSFTSLNDPPWEDMKAPGEHDHSITNDTVYG